MKYAVQMTSDVMIHIASFVMNGLGIQVILRLKLRQFERLQCWYYYREQFMVYAVEMGSDGTILYVPSVIRTGKGV
jgi:hypothetical protein